MKTATVDQGFGSNNYLTVRESYKLQCCWWLALKWSHLEVRCETADCELVTDTEHCGVSLSEWMDFEFKDCRQYTQQVSSEWSGAIILDNQQHQEVFYYRSAQEFARPNYTTRTQYSHCQERLLSYCLQLEFQASYCEKCTINRTSYLSGGILEGYVLWKLLSTIASLIAAALAPAHIFHACIFQILSHLKSVFDHLQQVHLIIEDEAESLHAGTHTHEETFPTSVL